MEVALVFMLFVGVFVACACVIVPLVALLLSTSRKNERLGKAKARADGRDSLEPLSHYADEPPRPRKVASVLHRGGASSGERVNHFEHGLVNAEESREKTVPAPEATV